MITWFASFSTSFVLSSVSTGIDFASLHFWLDKLSTHWALGSIPSTWHLRKIAGFSSCFLYISHSHRSHINWMKGWLHSMSELMYLGNRNGIEKKNLWKCIHLSDFPKTMFCCINLEIKKIFIELILRFFEGESHITQENPGNHQQPQ